ERLQLAREHTERPPVRHDMVQIHEEAIAVVLELEEPRPEQGPASQVERSPGLFSDQPLGLLVALAFRELAEVHERQREPRGGAHDLGRLPVDQLERGSQRLVPAQDLVQAPLQRRYVDRSAQRQRDRDVVGGGARGELLEEPEPLLGERERQRAGARRGPQRRGRRRGGAIHRAQVRQELRFSLGELLAERRGQYALRRAHAELVAVDAEGDVERAQRRQKLFNTHSSISSRSPCASTGSADRVSAAQSIVSIRSACSATVCASKIMRSGSCTPKSRCRRVTSWVASSEWPPRSKKLS